MRDICPTALAGLLLTLLIIGLTEGTEVDHGANLIKWLRSKGGTVNEKLVIRRADPDDDTSRFGMFTTEDLSKKEILLVIPDECVVSAETDEEEEEEGEDEDEEEGSPAMDCQLVRNLVEEMELGDDSRYAPYVNYLLAEPFGQLPSAWSDEGKEFFTDMLENYTKEPIPPIEPADWLDDWHIGCKGSDIPLEENAALHVTQRSWDDILIPVYDMMSHRNGKYFNTESNGVHEEDDIMVKAKRDILAGEEINTSYNLCEDCGNRKETYGTPEILRDYGFVEQYPQRWIFPDSVGFEIDEEEEGSGILSLNWLDGLPNIQDVLLLQDIQKAMAAFGETKLKTPSELIPTREIEAIRQFHGALTQAVDIALETSYSDDEACSDKSEDQVCTVPKSRYDDLKLDSDMEYEMKVCDIDRIMKFEDYDIIEEIKTPYQFISVMHNPETEDTCFDLDDTVQICSSYRPHYHEMSVHYAARYLKTVERVLFVGGGDSMLLHELLLYPSIQTVVGLELDQKVTRMSFKYFGTQPHWDDDRVEWWFGDATKSLTMVPKEYFGSFDMVLVDLSETVMSFKVTTGLDIMEALSLLLKPEGVMLKNELYFEAMSEIFEHTLQYHYYDVPVICSQSMVIGSNSIDFFRQENLTEHEVDTLLIGPLSYKEHFALYHDYAWIPDNKKKHCARDDDELEKVPLRQATSPGIVMIIEAEEAIALEGNTPLTDIVDVILSAIKGQGFNMISTIASDDEEEATVIVMKEGYVVLRFWREASYCGFDIHLWSSFEKQPALKTSLLSAVGSSNESSSSFRVVAGGMFGVSTWKNDTRKRGPRRTLDCGREDTKVSEKEVDNAIMDIILEESITFVPKDATVLVICGLVSSHPCRSRDKLERDQSVKEVTSVWSCAHINEFEKDAALKLYGCERDLLNEIRSKVHGDKKIGAIIIDPAMPYSMGQVLIRIFKNLKSRIELLTDNPTIMALSMDETEPWRSNLINRFRTDVILHEPLLNADTSFQGETTFADLNIVTTNQKSGDVRKMREMLNNVERRTGLRASIEEVLGGSINYESVHTPKDFVPSDYDQSPQSEQWSSQEPLEFQTIFQLEGQREKSKLAKIKIRAALEKTLQSVNSNESPSGDAKIHEFTTMGDGCLLVAVWYGSSAIIVWDGRQHVDINLTIDEEDDDYFDAFEKSFIKELPVLKTTLRDEQPRGYGRVVNFSDDISIDSDPLWA